MILSRHQFSLTTKITFSIALAAIGFLTLFSILAIYSNERLEYALLEQQLEEELNSMIQKLTVNPQSELPQTANLKYYLKSRDGASLPQSFHTLSPGVYHDHLIEGHPYHVEVSKLGNDLIYLRYDISAIEESEQILVNILLAAWIIMIVLVIILAKALSRYLADPITKLSDEVSQLDPDHRGIQIQGQFTDGEVGQIAAAFDLYLKRMDQYVEKQQAFTAMVSHELRSPMTIVQTSADLIAYRQQDPDIIAQLDKIRRATSTMSDTVHALLQITRDAGDNKEKESIALKALVNDVLELLQPDIRFKQITVSNKIDDTIMLDASRTLLTVVCTNLIKNAVKHGGDSQIDITWKENSLLITDNGIGIDPADLDHIFEFAKKGQHSQGYGIGLYVSKMICDHQSWQLSLSPAADGGTTASVSFT